jgi:hypothetical protein
MKFATAWWGVQIAAETEEDKEVLDWLQELLPAGADIAYEDGEVYEVEEPSGDFGFEKRHVENCLKILEFRR